MNPGDTQRTIGEFPPGPSAYTEEVAFTADGATAELRCTHERDGSLYASGLRFRSVRAYRFRAEGHCTAWHMDAYDTLVEVEDSDWIGELLAAEPSETWGGWAMRHHLIFIDSAGAYEVAAEECEWLPEGAVV